MKANLEKVTPGTILRSYLGFVLMACTREGHLLKNENIFHCFMGPWCPHCSPSTTLETKASTRKGRDSLLVYLFNKPKEFWTTNKDKILVQYNSRVHINSVSRLLLRERRAGFGHHPLENIPTIPVGERYGRLPIGIWIAKRKIKTQLPMRSCSF